MRTAKERAQLSTAMRYSEVEKLCLSLPGVTKEFPFGSEPVFKVGGRMFALISLSENGKPDGLWFKAGEASFAILTRLKGISPSPYLARAHWVALDDLDALDPGEIRAYLKRAHAMVAAGLSRRKRAELGINAPD